LKCDSLVITRGEQGMTVFESGKEAVHIPVLTRQTFDVTGAGDTVVAVLAMALAAGFPLEEGAFAANIAAGIVVGKIGTVAVTSQQLINRARELEGAIQGK
jgi:bifunctional ADP-heptose synthase (sugar kinase/adenylyltransferase)